ncbi:hypothetical protein DFJ73DRAFT_342460 [Zopfochytrium polystomum]|nr:hypothetical protein DFJ73DRAFT_342460 [Zopfochytrium polystomum]
MCHQSTALKWTMPYFSSSWEIRDLAISYFKEALASAKVMHHNRTAEIEAAFALGGVLEKAGQLVESLEYFEHSRSMSIDKDVQEFEIASSKSIVSSRMKIAELLEKRRNFADAIKHYTECISVIKTSTPNDERLLNEIHFRLGNAHKQHGDIETAVEYLQHYLEKCEEIGDKINAGRARTALAACNESSSNPTQATDYLEQFVSMTVEDSSQKNSLSQACKQLGVLYNKMEKFDKAVHYFDWHFRLEREATAVMAEVVGQTSAVGRNPDENNNYGLPHEAKNPGFAVAQVQVGLSKGNARMREFFLCVVEADSGTRAKPNAADRMRELLYWKSTRLPFFGPLDKPLQDARVEEGATNTVT